MNTKPYFYINKVIPGGSISGKRSLSWHAVQSLKTLRKLDKWKTKREVSGLKTCLQQLNSI